MDKNNETYFGTRVRLRYFIRVKILRHYLPNIIKTKDLAIQNLQSPPPINTLNMPIKVQVGIENCLHIEFEYRGINLHLRDVVIGRVFFLLVQIKIKHMELILVRREVIGTNENPYIEHTNLARYEIMDGNPVQGESIPIRMFLTPFNLGPTLKNVHNKFSVQYYINLILVDEENRRYFKLQEIYLWRKNYSVSQPLSFS